MTAVSEDSSPLRKEKRMVVPKDSLAFWKQIFTALKQSTLHYMDSISMANQ
jgi:hypothetical protein